MIKKIVVCLLLAVFLPAVSPVEAQQAKRVPQIGFVSATGDPTTPGPSVEAFRQGLRDLGYIEGKNILIEYRYIEGKLDQASSLVVELVRLKVDVIFVGTLPGIRAAKQATKTIPIVMLTFEDPVAAGLIDSLARPGANITGLTTLVRELSGKRLELLKEVIPGISRVGVLWDANAPGPVIALKEYEAAAAAIKLHLQSLDVRGPKPDLDGAFQSAAKGSVHALVAISNPVLQRYAKRVSDLAIEHRLPLVCERSEYVEAGGLISYSVNIADQYRRAATYVDKILKGRKPADLPVEQPMKFDLIINLKTAKQIGLTIPPNVLVRADKVIR